MITTLRGKVGDGQGLVSVAFQNPTIKSMVGTVYPGSLNVFVAGKHNYAPNLNYPLPQFLMQQGGLFMRSCKVNGVDAFLLRCECPGPTFQSRRVPPIPPPHTMFEIVATAFINGASYASDVTIEIDDRSSFAWLPWP